MSDFSDLYDISGLTPELARSQVLDVMTQLKSLEAQIGTLAEEEKTWEGRVKLAQEKGRTDLQSQAQTELDRVKLKKGQIESETAGVRSGVERMRSTLNSPSFQASGAHAYAEGLMAELEMQVGPPDTLTPELEKLSTEAELEKLKKQAGG